MKRDIVTRPRSKPEHVPASAHRSREGQRRENIEKQLYASRMPARSGGIERSDPSEMIDESPRVSNPALHDSELPPPPQLRCARTTADKSKSPKDKNTGIKHRDASGKKHSAQSARRHAVR